jgi:hypothetical protein
MADKLVTITDYQFLPEAEAARAHLEAAGIFATLTDAETVNMDWFLGNAIGYIKLQVPEERARDALAIVKRMRLHAKHREAAGGDAAVCLECGAAMPTQDTCPACGWSFGQGEAAEPDSPEPAADADTAAAGGSPLETLRSIKRPILLVLFWPLLLAIGLLALVILAWLVRGLMH